MSGSEGYEEGISGFIKIKIRLTAYVGVDCDTTILAINVRSKCDHFHTAQCVVVLV